MKRFLVVLAGLMLAGCGAKDENGDGIADGVRAPDSVTLVAPSTPLGSISGTVLNSRHQPVADATVSLNISAVAAEGGTATPGPTTTRTDGNGFFSVGKLPAGSNVQVVMTKEGHSTARQTVNIPAAAGNFPINNGNATVGPVALFELNETIKVQILTHSGRPAVGAKAYLDAFPAFLLLPSSGLGGSSDYGSQRDTIVVEATADATGTLTFAGIPNRTDYERINASYVVSVQAHDENGDGVPDSAGTVRSLSGQSLVIDPSLVTIQLSDARSQSAFAIVATNAPGITEGGAVASIENFVNLSESITVVFNHPVQASSVVARIIDETLLREIPVTTTVSSAGNTVSITPGTPLVNGAKYHGKFRVRSLSTGQEIARQGFFFAGDRRQPLPLEVVSVKLADAGVLNVLETGESVRVTFNQPIRQFGGARDVQAFFNAQTNGTGSIGDAPGEYGNDAGFPLSKIEHANEPNQLFAVAASDSSSTWDFFYGGTPQNPATGLEVFLQFQGTRGTVSGYETMWGQPIETELSGLISQP